MVKKIVEKGGDYLLNLKANQAGSLLELEEHFKPAYKKEMVTNISVDQGHGRVETRTMESLVGLSQFKELELYKDLDKWENIQSIHKMTRVRFDKKSGAESQETSYFISSLKSPYRVFSLIRDHWDIVNNLHYCLDIIMGEDNSIKRQDNEAKKLEYHHQNSTLFHRETEAKNRHRKKNIEKNKCSEKAT